MVSNTYIALFLNKKKVINLFNVFRSSDGRILIASSTDGYCSIIQFQKGELGEEYKKENNIATNSNAEQPTSSSSAKDISEKSIPTIDIDNSAMDIEIVKSKEKEILNENPECILNQDNKLLNNTVDKENDLKNKEPEDTEDIKLVYNEESITESTKAIIKHTPKKEKVPLIIPNRKPRRVQLITLSSPKGFKKE